MIDLADNKTRCVTLRHLLNMNSGLKFDETYWVFGDATHMLFTSDDSAAYALQYGLAYEPGTHWYYSSGTTNIISLLLRRSFTEEDGGDIAYLAYPWEKLFDPMGMEGMPIMEIDAAGTFVGSSFAFLTARDWARFGLLYLQDGVWNGKPLLPPSWVNFTRQPAAGSKGSYGGQFWLRPTDDVVRAHKAKGAPQWLLLFPEDTYYAHGFEEQTVVVVPSLQLVMVRTGYTKSCHDFDGATVMQAVLDVVRKL